MQSHEVMKEVLKKTSAKQIAAEMGIGVGTIYTYIRRIYEKLHVNSRTEAVVKYLGGVR